MIKFAQSILKFSTQPVVFDGIIYFIIAVFGYLSTAFGSDEAAKYIGPLSLFWLRTSAGAVSAGGLALKMYRSTTFAEYRQAKNGSYHTGETSFLTKDEIKTTPTAKSTGS